MSQENVELAHQAYEAWNRGDLGWHLNHMTDDFEFWPGLGFSDMDGVYRGKAGWRRFAQTWREAWEGERRARWANRGEGSMSGAVIDRRSATM
jgi:ketosteroid isomerase-like protein